MDICRSTTMNWNALCQVLLKLAQIRIVFTIPPLSARAMGCSLSLKELESPWVYIVVVVLEKDMFKVVILLLSPSCKGARPSICIQINSIEPIWDNLCSVWLKLSQLFFSVKSLRHRKKPTTMPGKRIS